MLGKARPAVRRGAIFGHHERPVAGLQREEIAQRGFWHSAWSAREEEVVKLVAESQTSEEIADLLHISRRTVERHRENILAKLGLTDRIQLTRYAIRRGLIDP